MNECNKTPGCESRCIRGVVGCSADHSVGIVWDRSTTHDKIKLDTTNDLDAKAAFERMCLWAGEIEFMDYTFIVTLNQRGELYMRAEYSEPDTYSGEEAKQVTRRWLLTPPMTKSEFVQTCFKCALTSMEHRTREAFKYKGRRVFGPHFDVDDLWALCADRENAGGRT